MMRRILTTSLTAVLLSASVLVPTRVLRAEVTDGFTEPYQSIGVASAEAGVVQRLFVREGDSVKAGDKIAVLDDDVYRALVAIAKQQAEAVGRLQAANAEFEMYRRRFDKLSTLRLAGQAHQEELERARADMEVAEGRLLAEREQQALMQLELEKANIQLARRTIVAPVDGKVLELLKRPGEYVSPAAPELMLVVQLNPLRAEFLVPQLLAAKLKKDEKVEIKLPIQQRAVEGTVEFVSDVIDSGTVKVKVRIDNSSGQLRGGEKCELQFK